MGEISDMSGLNDAFNSTICSLKARVRFSGKGKRKRRKDGKQKQVSGRKKWKSH